MANKIFIAGAGGIGQAAGLILADSKILEVELVFGDISKTALDKTLQFIKEGSSRPIVISAVIMEPNGARTSLESVLDTCDVILDCLPGKLAPEIAMLAKKHNCHYANLTEYVNETNIIKEIAKDANTAFVLQTGLAPGFINVLASRLYETFQAKYGNNNLEEMMMKVGALPQNAGHPHFYAFTWSPIGVATEYLKNAIIVDNHKKVEIAALSDTESIIINGDRFEDNYTSGGAADLPDVYLDRIKKLHYKTLRQPGHYQWIKRQLETIPEGMDRIATLEKIMLDSIPSVENDMIIIYSSVEGFDSNGVRRRLEKAYKILPSKVGNKTLRAIQSTTASALCQIAYMLIQNNWKGLILQSQVPTLEFLNGPFVSSIYGNYVED
jgi:saccharopine dehydrogenase-like NADP-dependent oxidoreductase